LSSMGISTSFVSGGNIQHEQAPPCQNVSALEEAKDEPELKSFHNTPSTYLSDFPIYYNSETCQQTKSCSPSLSRTSDATPPGQRNEQKQLKPEKSLSRSSLEFVDSSHLTTPVSQSRCSRSQSASVILECSKHEEKLTDACGNSQMSPSESTNSLHVMTPTTKVKNNSQEHLPRDQNDSLERSKRKKINSVVGCLPKDPATETRHSPADSPNKSLDAASLSETIPALNLPRRGQKLGVSVLASTSEGTNVRETKTPDRRGRLFQQGRASAVARSTRYSPRSPTQNTRPRK